MTFGNNRTNLFLIPLVTLTLTVSMIPVYGSYDSYHSTVVKEVGNTLIDVVAVKGDMDVFNADISSTSDHRDTMVYLFHAFDFTLGAGYYAEKDGSGVQKNELVYYYDDDEDSLSHFKHNPFDGDTCLTGKVRQVSEGSSDYKGIVEDCNGNFIFSITVTPPTPSSSDPPVGAVARAMETDSGSDTLPGDLNSISIGYWDNGNLITERVDSDVTVDEYKCASEDTYLYDLITSYYEFDTGDGHATTDNCSNESSSRKAPGE